MISAPLNVRAPNPVVRVAAAVIGVAVFLTRPAVAQELLPDIIPYVSEDQRFLVDWRMGVGEIRLHTMFANIGDGMYQIRSTDEGTEGVPEPIYQRVFVDEDMGDEYNDYPINETDHFENSNIFFPDYMQFQLLEAVIDSEGTVTVGDVASSLVKTSCFLFNSQLIPDPPYEGNQAEYPRELPTDYGMYQNVNVGWGDIYSYGHPEQLVPLDGVEIGPLYWLRQTANPAGKIMEKDYTNNSFEILIDLNVEREAVLNADGAFVQPGDRLQLLPGDYNQDGTVNAADYVVYRNLAGSESPLPNRDPEAEGTIGSDDYDFWVTHYGNVLNTESASGAAASHTATLPEPAAGLLAALAFFTSAFGVRRRNG